MIEIKKNIVWLASYPKSGNTWIRIILENLLYPHNKFDLNNMKVTKHASARVLFDEYSGTASTDLSEGEIRKLLPRVYREISERSDDLVFLKVHEAWKRPDEGSSIYKQEVTRAAVYIIRNPLDIAVSFSHHSKKEVVEVIEDMNNSESGFCRKHDRVFNQLEQVMLNWSENVLSWTEQSVLPTIVVRYEDLLVNTIQEIKKITKFIGMRHSEKEISDAIKKSEFSHLKEIEEAEGFKEKPIKMDKFFRKGKAGDWEKYLSAQESKEIISRHKEVMEKFGYQQ